MLYNDIFWRFRLTLPWKNNNIFPLIDGVDVAISYMKMFSGDTETQCCRATKYFVLLLTIRSIKYFECLYSCPRYSAYKWHFLCAVWFFHIPHTRQDFWKKKCFLIKYVFWFSLQVSSETFINLRTIQCDMIISVRRSWCNYPLFLSDFN